MRAAGQVKIYEIRKDKPMIAERMKPLMANNSAVRQMFEEGNKLRAKYGKENV